MSLVPVEERLDGVYIKYGRELRDKVSYDLLVKSDTTSMAVSLELRAPMLDERVVELGLWLPRRLKLAGRKGKQAPQPKRRSTKGVSGNPAKRSLVPTAPTASPAAEPQVSAFDEFGLSTGAPSADPFGLGGRDEFQLSPELARMFDQPKNKGPR